jgi:uncharacterized membrane protein YidH (DUF202 family)
MPASVLDLSKVVRQRQTQNPRTVLAFYATVLGLILAAVVGLVLVLAATGIDTGLIPAAVVFAGAVSLSPRS